MRRNLILVGALLLGWTASIVAFGAVRIDVPAQTAEHSLVVFSCGTPNAVCSWAVIGPRGEEETYRAGTGGVFTGPPGQYVLLLNAQVSGAMEQAWAMVQITEDENGPDPPKPDPPKPDPPDPAPGPKKVSIIYEQSTLTPAQSAILSSKVWRDWMKSNDHEFRVWDKDIKRSDDQISPEVKELLEEADLSSLPVCFVTDANGDTVESPLPLTDQGIIDLVKKYGG